MGMDFAALMKYGGPDEGALDGLETGSPAEVRARGQLLRERGFAPARPEDAAVWEFTSRPEVRDPRLDGRPFLPDQGVALHLPEGFLLTFGPDAVEVYHLLRWFFFLTEPDLQRAMLGACVCLGRLFGATDCIVTSDFSPIVQAFRRGLGFDASLAAAGPEDGERPSLADLYVETEGVGSRFDILPVRLPIPFSPLLVSRPRGPVHDRPRSCNPSLKRQRRVRVARSRMRV
jgi:hypothetical protein